MDTKVTIFVKSNSIKSFPLNEKPFLDSNLSFGYIFGKVTVVCKTVHHFVDFGVSFHQFKMVSNKDGSNQQVINNQNIAQTSLLGYLLKQGRSVVLEPGVHDFPFTLKISSFLPPTSTKDSSLTVKYYLKASVFLNNQPKPVCGFLPFIIDPSASEIKSKSSDLPPISNRDSIKVFPRISEGVDRPVRNSKSMFSVRSNTGFEKIPEPPQESEVTMPFINVLESSSDSEPRSQNQKAPLIISPKSSLQSRSFKSVSQRLGKVQARNPERQIGTKNPCHKYQT
ncbi:hypothetical protein BB560_006978 [Smittium megazygosporum]|uniref:Uncharacterized protein n=1 Tax=Smittium megazygosporum TaxID=133381 RepID=A0A2T9XZT6_9FUNG|nr:hypothetical protein BB560_006978 [Smittium megazygosporum]